MSDSSSNGTGGLGLAGVTFAVVLVLKLVEVGAVAEWSWWWVTAPLWISFSVFFAVGFVRAMSASKRH